MTVFNEIFARLPVNKTTALVTSTPTGREGRILTLSRRREDCMAALRVAEAALADTPRKAANVAEREALKARKDSITADLREVNAQLKQARSANSATRSKLLIQELKKLVTPEQFERAVAEAERKAASQGAGQ